MKKTPVNEHEIYGVLYQPNRLSDKLPRILLLSGSEGGVPGSNAIPDSFIEALVKQGFMVFALAYFGVGKLPKNLQNINLEYFELAIEWLQSFADGKKNKVVIIGQSRGAELALILGTISKKISAIVAYAPSNLITGGFPYPNQPAWNYKNNPLKFFSGAVSNNNLNVTELDDLNYATNNNLIPYHENTENDPFIIADLFAARNANAKNAEIPVEKITCPILLFSGGKDAIWPSTDYCQSIIKRLEDHNALIQRKHIHYEHAGHGLIASYEAPIFHPVGKFWCVLGGEPVANQQANQDSLRETLAFLLAL